MAGGLNLIPNPGVLAIVAVIFWAAMRVVKHYFIEPYLKLQQKRDGMTTGGQTEAEARLAEVKAKQQDLEQRLAASRAEAFAKKEKLILDTQKDAKSILVKAKAEADAEIAASRQQISERVKEESGKISGHARKLADEFYAAVTR